MCVCMIIIIYRNYGCGVAIPEGVEGRSVLDLGSGAGLDCFVLSRLVGESGRVVGVDMTKEQVRLDLRKRHLGTIDHCICIENFSTKDT